MDSADKVLEILKQSGALLKGHFILRSGLHSEFYLQCARVGEDMAAMQALGKLGREKLKDLSFNTILAPAMGALVFGQEIARGSKKRFVFLDKENGSLCLKRGFTFQRAEKVLLVEDVITQGGRVREALDILREHKARCVGVLAIVYRNQQAPDFGVPFFPLTTFPLPTYSPHKLPEKLQQIPPLKPGSP